MAAAVSQIDKLDRRYVIIRGQTYDVTDMHHPGGRHMLDLAVARDATIMFESAHIRLEKAETLLSILPKGPKLEELEKLGYKFDRPKEDWSTPSQSELFCTIRKRIVEEILKPMGRATGGTGARGVPWWHIASVVVTWLTAAVWFVTSPGLINGAVLGFAMCWVGLAVQHTANHGGLTKSTTLSYWLGLLNDVGPGGSSLVWRYHHQVSHHTYCNDGELDQDAHSSFPMIRMDPGQELQPHHKWQFLYAPPMFCFLYFSIQMSDIQQLLDARAFLVNFSGTGKSEIALAFLLKFVHVAWLYALPAYLHGLRAMILPWMATLMVGSFFLATTFIVSHNIEGAKEAEMLGDKSDWAKYQIETTASWGGRLGSFFTGGLNLQIEHHLFPCLPHHIATDVQVIVKEECKKRNIVYKDYATLFSNFADHLKFLYSFGRPSKEAKAAGIKSE